MRTLLANEPPVLVNNELTIMAGETKVLTGAELSATDPDTNDDALVFDVSEVQHGEFSYVNSTITLNWTQAQLIAGNISFTHDSSLVAPTYLVRVSDGVGVTEWSRPRVQFSADFSEGIDEFQVNTYTSSSQSSPSVASFSDGRFVVTWDSDQDGSYEGIYGQLFNSDGSKNGAEFQMNTYTANRQHNPSVASFSDGRFVVTWMSSDQDNLSYGIYGQLFNNDGSKSGAEFQVNTYTANAQMSPSVASFSDSRFVVTWASYIQDGSNNGIYGQLFNSDGSKSGTEFQVNTYTTSTQYNPSAASFSDGRFVVTWQSEGQDGSYDGIYGQLFNNDGSKSGTEFQVNTYTTNSQYNPSVTSFSDSQFVMTWASEGQDSSSYGVYGQLFNSAGRKSGMEFQVNTYTANAQYTPSVASFSDGRFVVTWTSGEQDGSSSGVYGQLFNSASSKNGAEFQVNTYTTEEQSGPSVASFSDGRFIVTMVEFLLEMS